MPKTITTRPRASARAVAGKGSNAKRHAKNLAKEMAKITMGRVGVRAVARVPGERGEIVWDATWGGR